MSYQLVWEPQGVTLSFCGKISFADVREATVGYQGDYRFDALHYVIADYLRITGCEVNPAEMEYVWALDVAAGITNPKIRKAVVAIDPTVIALKTHCKTLSIGPYPTEVFANLEDARRWLGVGMSR